MVKDSFRDVLMFIGRFSTDGNSTRNEVIDAFTHGCCYWFAYILVERFKNEYNSYIVIDYIANHFAASIDGRVYDITGEVPTMYNWEKWEDCYEDDINLYDYITKDCIMF